MTGALCRYDEHIYPRSLPLFLGLNPWARILNPAHLRFPDGPRRARTEIVLGDVDQKELPPLDYSHIPTYGQVTTRSGDLDPSLLLQRVEVDHTCVLSSSIT